MGDRYREDNNLNRSRRERLNKAAKQGYGPLVDMGLVSAPGLSRYPDARRSRSRSRRGSRSRSRERSRERSRDRDRDRDRERRLDRGKAPPREPEAKRPASEDEADVDGFLAPKRPGAAQKKALGPSKLEVKISSGTNTRAMAAGAGARPKAAPMKAPTDEELLRQRQTEEQRAQEFEQLQTQVKQAVLGQPGEAGPSGSAHDDEEKQKQKEEKRKREEWRKRWKEDKKRREKDRGDDGRRHGDAPRSDSSGDRGDEDTKEAKERFTMWRALNNNGVTTARDAQRKYVGQVTDAALDARLREHPAMQQSGKLMTEAEALARLQRKR